MWRKDLLHRSYLYKTLQVLTYVSDRLYFTQCLTSFSSIDHLLQLCARFLILYGTLSIYPSAMCLSLKTLKTIIRTGLTILVKLIYLFYYIFSTSNNLTQMVNFFSWIPDCDIDSPDPFDLFHCFDASIFSTMLSFNWEILPMLLFHFPLTLHHVHSRMSRFITLLMTILVLIRTVFVIICEMLHGRIYLNSMLLLLLVNFASGFRLRLMYISLIESIRSSFTYRHGFQQNLLLP